MQIETNNTKIKENVNNKNKEEKRMKETKKGISLIVLVITIIVMIILASAVMISLSNSGIINKANNAVDKTNLKQVQQIAALAWADAYADGKTSEADLKAAVEDALKANKIDENKYNVTVTENGVEVTEKTEGNQGSVTQTSWRIEREKAANGLITKAVVTDGTIEYEIGTTVNYMPEGVGPTAAKYTGGWKLLGVDDEGRLLIMSTDSITGSDVDLGGQEAFLNGIATLENAVSGYKDGTIGVAVRSVTVEDIDAVTGYNPDTFTAVTYSWDGTEYPKYSYVVNGVTKTGNLKYSHSSKGFTYYDVATNSFKTVEYTTTPGTIATVKNDRYVYIGREKYAETSKAYKMLFLTADEMDASMYWLASRCVYAGPDDVWFGVRFVYGCQLNGCSLVSSYGYPGVNCVAVRAVVTLASGITLQDSATTVGTYDIVQ